MREGIRRLCMRVSWALLLGGLGAAVGLRCGRPLYYTDGGAELFAPALAEAAMLRLSSPEPLCELPGPVQGRVAALPDGRLLYGRTQPAGDSDLVLFDPTRPGVPPEPAYGLNTAAHELAPAVLADGTVYFASDRPGGSGGFDLYRARWRGGGFAELEPVPACNTLRDETDPAPAADGRTLVFARVDPSVRSGRNGQLLLADLQAGREAQPVFPSAAGRRLDLQPEDRDPWLDASGHRLWFVRRLPGQPPRILCSVRTIGAFAEPLRQDATFGGRSLRSPLPAADGLSLRLLQPGEPALWFASRAEPLQPWWQGQRALELWLLGLCLGAAVLLLLLHLGRRWRALDLLTQCLLLSLLLHLLLMLWLVGVEVSGSSPPGEDQAGAIEVTLLPATGATAAADDGPRSEQLAASIAFEPEARTLEAAAPGTAVAAAERSGTAVMTPLGAFASPATAGALAPPAASPSDAAAELPLRAAAAAAASTAATALPALAPAAVAAAAARSAVDAEAKFEVATPAAALAGSSRRQLDAAVDGSAATDPAAQRPLQVASAVVQDAPAPAAASSHAAAAPALQPAALAATPAPADSAADAAAPARQSLPAVAPAVDAAAAGSGLAAAERRPQAGEAVALALPSPPARAAAPPALADAPAAAAAPSAAPAPVAALGPLPAAAGGREPDAAASRDLPAPAAGVGTATAGPATGLAATPRRDLATEAPLAAIALPAAPGAWAAERQPLRDGAAVEAPTAAASAAPPRATLQPAAAGGSGGPAAEARLAARAAAPAAAAAAAAAPGSALAAAPQPTQAPAAALPAPPAMAARAALPTPRLREGSAERPATTASDASGDRQRAGLQALATAAAAPAGDGLAAERHGAGGSAVPLPAAAAPGSALAAAPQPTQAPAAALPAPPALAAPAALPTPRLREGSAERPATTASDASGDRQRAGLQALATAAAAPAGDGLAAERGGEAAGGSAMAVPPPGSSLPRAGVDPAAVRGAAAPAPPTAMLRAAAAPRLSDIAGTGAMAQASPPATTRAPALQPLASVTMPAGARLRAEVLAARSDAGPGQSTARLPLPGSLLARAAGGSTSLPPSSTPLAASAYSNRFGPARQQALEQYGGSAATELAVARGLRYLASIQNADGSWGAQEHFDDKYGHVYIGKTALCVLAFLGAGHTPSSRSEHSGAVLQAVRHLLSVQDADSGAFGQSSAYGHGIATYALAECYGMSKDPQLLRPVEAALAWILQHQGPRRDRRNQGGWGYFSPGLAPEDDYARVPITVWMVMALESARLGGIDLPQAVLPQARRYLEQAFDAQHRWFRYNHKPSRLNSAWPTLPASTPAGAFGLLLLGEDKDSERVRAAVDFTVARRPQQYRRYADDEFVLQAQGNVYFWYYGSLLCFLHGGEAWQRWNERLSALLPAAQDEDGSFAPIDVYARYAGDTAAERSYTTALCVLSLEIYYRYFTPLLLGR